MKRALLPLFLLAACGGEDPAPETDAPADAAKIAAALAELPDADRKLAEAQKDCVVSGEPLGSMGKPVRVEHEGKVAFLCCERCMKKFQSDPAMYVAKAGGD